jgi:hypothetical protein
VNKTIEGYALNVGISNPIGWNAITLNGLALHNPSWDRTGSANFKGAWDLKRLKYESWRVLFPMTYRVSYL